MASLNLVESLVELEKLVARPMAPRGEPLPRIPGPRPEDRVRTENYVKVM